MKTDKTYRVDDTELVPTEYNNPFEDEGKFDVYKIYIRKGKNYSQITKETVDAYHIYSCADEENDWQEVVVFETELQTILLALPLLCKGCKDKIRMKKVLEIV